MTTERIRSFITEHKVNPVNDKIDIEVMDLPGPGGANHSYQLTFSDKAGNAVTSWLFFQNGPIAETGVNGITHEALLAIILHRMRAFQSGPYKCRENALAITHMEEAQNWLNRRTLSRMARGVEGTHKL
jgi:hypothetical protein